MTVIFKRFTWWQNALRWQLTFLISFAWCFANPIVSAGWWNYGSQVSPGKRQAGSSSQNLQGKQSVLQVVEKYCELIGIVLFHILVLLWQLTCVPSSRHCFARKTLLDFNYHPLHSPPTVAVFIEVNQSKSLLRRLDETSFKFGIGKCICQGLGRV